jgi:hypothetical protein
MNLSASDILKTVDTSPASLAGLSTAKGSAAAKGVPGASSAFAQLLKHRAALASANAQVAGTEGLGEEGTQHRQEAEKAAGDLVSNALILPMLKQLRHSAWGQNTVFSRGIGEKAFGPQFDMQISDRIAHSPRLGLKTALTERLLKRGQGNARTDATQSASPQTPGRLDLHG